MSMASVTDFTDGDLVDELQDRGFTVTWGRDAEIDGLHQQLAGAQSDAKAAWEKVGEACTAHANSIKQVWQLIDFIEGIANSTPSDDTDGAPSEAWEFLEKFNKGPKP